MHDRFEFTSGRRENGPMQDNVMARDLVGRWATSYFSTWGGERFPCFVSVVFKTSKRVAMTLSRMPRSGYMSWSGPHTRGFGHLQTENWYSTRIGALAKCRNGQPHCFGEFSLARTPIASCRVKPEAAILTHDSHATSDPRKDGPI